MRLDLCSIGVVVSTLLTCACGEVGNVLDSYGMQVEHRIAEARCERLREPGCQGNLAQERTQVDCVNALTNIARAHAIDRGDIVVDDVALTSCLANVQCLPDALGAPGVAASDPWVACLSAFRGTDAPGGPCYLDEECGPGLRCDRSPASPCGTCMTKRTTGEACSRDAECAWLTADAVGMCISGICMTVSDAARFATIGERCGLVNVGTTSAASTTCATGLYCTNNGSAVLSCVEPGGLGAECIGVTCGPGLACQGRACRPVQSASLLGELCGSSPDGDTFISCEATTRLTCVDSRCAARPALGEPCGGAAPACASGICRAGVCGPPGDSGSACSDDRRCVSGACIDGACVTAVCN